MSMAVDFLSLFDEQGHYKNGEGEVDVVFLTQGGAHYPGKLQFKGSLLVGAEMAGYSRWSYPDGSPLDGLKFQLQFPADGPGGLVVDRGRVVPISANRHRPSRESFLANIRNARNLLVHSGSEPTSSAFDETSVSDDQRRGAIWITPKSVGAFDVAAFPELGPDEQAALSEAVQTFQAAASQVPADGVPSKDQYVKATAAFLSILDRLACYLPTSEEPDAVERALRRVAFPAWVVNWDYELDTGDEGEPELLVTVFAEPNVPRSSYGRFSIQFGPIIRRALAAEGVHRWPYIRLRTTAEYKTA